jgi:hypothetical protein
MAFVVSLENHHYPIRDNAGFIFVRSAELILFIPAKKVIGDMTYCTASYPAALPGLPASLPSHLVTKNLVRYNVSLACGGFPVSACKLD